MAFWGREEGAGRGVWGPWPPFRLVLISAPGQGWPQDREAGSSPRAVSTDGGPGGAE